MKYLYEKSIEKWEEVEARIRAGFERGARRLAGGPCAFCRAVEGICNLCTINHAICGTINMERELALVQKLLRDWYKLEPPELLKRVGVILTELKMEVVK